MVWKLSGAHPGRPSQFDNAPDEVRSIKDRSVAESITGRAEELIENLKLLDRLKAPHGLFVERESADVTQRLQEANRSNDEIERKVRELRAQLETVFPLKVKQWVYHLLATVEAGKESKIEKLLEDHVLADLSFCKWLAPEYAHEIVEQLDTKRRGEYGARQRKRGAYYGKVHRKRRNIGTKYPSLARALAIPLGWLVAPSEARGAVATSGVIRVGRAVSAAAAMSAVAGGLLWYCSLSKDSHHYGQTDSDVGPARSSHIRGQHGPYADPRPASAGRSAGESDRDGRGAKKDRADWKALDSNQFALHMFAAAESGLRLTKLTLRLGGGDGFTGPLRFVADYPPGVTCNGARSGRDVFFYCGAKDWAAAHVFYGRLLEASNLPVGNSWGWDADGMHPRAAWTLSSDRVVGCRAPGHIPSWFRLDAKAAYMSLCRADAELEICGKDWEFPDQAVGVEAVEEAFDFSKCGRQTDSGR